ncbi:MAG: nucleotidyltransferase domain-containing protein [Bdellovibrionales bacterium]|nr:nucleotidyltransferase domain-containing protein [Bdellovibrionales bacterium]
MTQKFGLKADTIKKIISIFIQHPNIKKVILYGSRAKGNFRPESDIDLTIIGPKMDLTELLQIETELDDLYLPYKIDLSLYHKLEDPNFIDHINRVGTIFYPPDSTE